MVQYLLNASAIWLISLVMFDVFLKKETYHNYNRFYLLLTFLLGSLLPLLQWQSNERIYGTSFGKPLQKVMAAKQNIVTTVPATTVSWEKWLIGIYIAGVLVTLCLLVIDIIKLAALYHKGQKEKQDNWIIVETSKGHAPFSFLHTLFICSKQQYNKNEWQMIVAHEKRHSLLYHFADLALMQIARIVFWFHPLIYVYNKRLLLVHEYQADRVSAKQPVEYCKFLVEQAVLGPAPSISHSFNRSPIKKRLLMLTRKSSSIARTKMLVFIPVVLVCVLCFSKNAFSQTGTGKIAVLPFGLTDTSLYHNKVTLTYAQALADPKLTCQEAGCAVVGFTISFLPKKGEFAGPYTMEGPEIAGTAVHSTMQPLNILKAYKYAGIINTRVFIEDIRVRCENGEIKPARSAIVTLVMK